MSCNKNLTCDSCIELSILNAARKQPCECKHWVPDNKEQKPSIGELYNELIYAVGKKYPGETRHQTALRYIREAENKKCIIAMDATKRDDPYYEQ